MLAYKKMFLLLAFVTIDASHMRRSMVCIRIDIKRSKKVSSALRVRVGNNFNDANEQIEATDNAVFSRKPQ